MCGVAFLSGLVLVVATVARPDGAGTARLDRPVASALVSVLLTLVGLAALASLALAAAVVLGRSRRRGPESAARRAASFRRVLAPIVLVAWMAAAALLARALARRHAPTALATAAAPSRVLQGAPHPLPFDPVAAGATLGAVALLATLALALGAATRPRGRRAGLSGLPPPRGNGGDSEASDDPTRRLAEALEAIEVPDPSSEPDPRRAVVAAWLSLEQAARAAGVARAASETAEELLAALQRHLGPAAAAGRRLTTAFEVARYSDHPVGEALRGECIAALAAVRAELAAAS